MAAFCFVMKSSISVKDSLSSLCNCDQNPAVDNVMYNVWYACNNSWVVLFLICADRMALQLAT